ncbi:glycine oxidase ThiO [Stratiformator vulcanicus]|uniref:Hydrogen cyanide synthase subunit HcnC n=1 Tax=Stratiformator vulcanicus TaxID=2527980 RepID=A0A517R646_9PLAN|nr:glycine oxidase ThiO [Stratiformator vulcanicus]QDT39332.1 Hydrogen cyanide synthase subunit HcnC precursor [Stratiformator vulcanicus]
MAERTDVTIVGGGVIGLTTALELADAGRTVCVIERGDFGQEASWAGAGMLRPANLEQAKTVEQRLRGYSFQMWPGHTARLKERTGIDPCFERCGSLVFGEFEHEAEELAAEGIEATVIDSERIRELVPGADGSISRALEVPAHAQLRNPRLLQSLLAACEGAGVMLKPRTIVTGGKREGDRIVELTTEAGSIASATYVIAAGAWSASLPDPLRVPLPIKPMRGQIALLKTEERSFRPCLHEGDAYLVPRADGRVLIGSTVEDAGFHKINTAKSVAWLLDSAKSLIPSLANAEVERTWAGLRPGSPDGLPFLGKAPEHNNLVLACGHFRWGLEWSPVTAKIIIAIIEGGEPPIDMTGLEVDRPLPREWVRK